jgi:hypothetical protein
MRWRLNTTHGPLKDGDDNCPFLHHARNFRTTGEADIYEASDHDSDPPAQLFFKEYSGDPFHPDLFPGTEVSGRLVRTEGRMCFHTYLTAVNLVTKSVVTLDEHHWTLNWGGSYEFDTTGWISDGIDVFLQHQPCERAGAYENLTDESATPFSLFMESAKRFWEVETPEGWTPWDFINHRATSDLAARPSWVKWTWMQRSN